MKKVYIITQNGFFLHERRQSFTSEPFFAHEFESKQDAETEIIHNKLLKKGNYIIVEIHKKIK